MPNLRDSLHAEHEARKAFLRQRSIERVRQRWRMSRRSFLLGAGASSLALPALADTPFTSFAYPVGPETTPLTTPTRFAYTVNVRGFGAVGNGTADDTAAFQNALNAAFAPSGGGGNSSGDPAKNVKLIIPPGNYLITSPLYIRNCLGGVIEGFGNGVSQLLWHPTSGAPIPPANGGGTYSGSDNAFSHSGQTPCIMTDAVAYMQFNSFGIEGPKSGPTFGLITNVGIDIWQSSSFGQTTANTFRNINFSSLGQGILADGANGCDNGLVEQCQFNASTFAGISMASSNALNWNCHGGGAANCGLGTGGKAAYYISTGGLSCYDIATTTNKVDFLNIYAGGSMNVVGGSSESQSIASSTSAPIIFTGVSFRMNPTNTVLALDLVNNGFMTLTGCWVAVATDTGDGVFAQLGNNGFLIINGCVFNPVAAQRLAFTGTPGSKLYCQGTYFAGTNANRVTGFTGTNVNTIGTGLGAFP